MNGRFIYFNTFQKWLTMLTDLKRVHGAQDKIEQSEILCGLFLVRKPHNCLIQEVHPLPSARFSDTAAPKGCFFMICTESLKTQ